MEEASQWFMELQQALAKEDRESLMRVTKSAHSVWAELPQRIRPSTFVGQRGLWELLSGLWSVLEHKQDAHPLMSTLKQRVEEWNAASITRQLQSIPSESELGQPADPGLVEGQTDQGLNTDADMNMHYGLPITPTPHSWPGSPLPNLGRRTNARAAKYKRGDLCPMPCDKCVELVKLCYSVDAPNVTACYDCKVLGKKCSLVPQSNRRQGELDDLVPIKEVKAELHALATTLNQSQEAHYTTLMLKLQDAAEERKILYQKLEIIEGWLMYPQALTIGQSAIGQSAIVDPPPTGEALTVEGLYQVQG